MPHSHHSLTRTHETFTEERSASKGLWRPSSPDLSSCDFYLWGYLKGKVYENNPKTIDELKENIRRSIEAIYINVLRKVSLNVISRAKKMRRGSRRPFPTSLVSFLNGL
jgi:hypothetical protein